MKRILLFLLLLSTGMSCQYFEECNGVRYQIRIKKELGGNRCFFRAEAVGSCLEWNRQNTIDFEDTCGTYQLSQVVERDSLRKKYGI